MGTVRLSVRVERKVRNEIKNIVYLNVCNTLIVLFIKRSFTLVDLRSPLRFERETAFDFRVSRVFHIPHRAAIVIILCTRARIIVSAMLFI